MYQLHSLGKWDLLHIPKICTLSPLCLAGESIQIILHSPLITVFPLFTNTLQGSASIKAIIVNGFPVNIHGHLHPRGRNLPEIFLVDKIAVFLRSTKKKRSRDTFVTKLSIGIDGNLFTMFSYGFIIQFLYLSTFYKGRWLQKIIIIIPELIRISWKSARIYFSVFYIIITILKFTVSMPVSHDALLFPSLQLRPQTQSHGPWTDHLFKPLPWESYQS